MCSAAGWVLQQALLSCEHVEDVRAPCLIIVCAVCACDWAGDRCMPCGNADHLPICSGARRLREVLLQAAITAPWLRLAGAACRSSGRRPQHTWSLR